MKISMEPSLKPLKFAIIRSRFNEEVTGGLEQGAVAYLSEQGIMPGTSPGTANGTLDFFLAPGAFELPLMAKLLAKTKIYDGIICLGCVIKGDTAHFEFISLGAATGLMQASLETETPISFGVLTTYTDEQAIIRSRPGTSENKGREAAAACFEVAVFKKKIRLLEGESD